MTTGAIDRRPDAGAWETVDVRRPGARLFELTWTRASVLLLLAGTAALYLWNLASSQWANAYYSAAAMAGSRSLLAWLFGSFDPGNAITIDKPPAALWVMSLSVRLFGLNPWSILVPQALMGVAATGLVYLTVRRAVGHLGGLVAGAAFATTPVAALMFRFNNPDALLVLLLVLSAYATVRAIGTASTRWLVLAAIAIGFAFLTKMLQAFLVIPALSAAYLVAAPTTLPRRIGHVAIAAATVIAISGSYLALVQLWPADSRPYIGGSQTNSIIDLLLNYDGFQRLAGTEVGRVGGANVATHGFGLFRLFQGETGTEISWLAPAALLALVAILWATRAAPRTDGVRAQAILWGGWLLVTGAVFSLMEGIFHPYYTVALAPAIAALVGIAVALAWRQRDDLRVVIAVAAGLALSVYWMRHLLLLSTSWDPWLRRDLPTWGAIAVAAIFIGGLVRHARLVRAPLEAGALAVALVVLLATPTIASVATAQEPHAGALPTAAPHVDPTLAQAALARPRTTAGTGNGFRLPSFGFGFGSGRPSLSAPSHAKKSSPTPFLLGGLLRASTSPSQVVAVLQAGADQFTWTAATTGAENAAGLALSSGTSVMAIGGFNSTDPSPTLAQFEADVAAGRIHYYVAGRDAAGFHGTVGGSHAPGQIAAWVEAHFPPTRVAGLTLYDLTNPR